MKLGVISDIHSNKVALDAVLADMPRVDRIVCAGDIVGYNPWPAECVETVRDVAAEVVMGNHDRHFPTPSKYRSNHMARRGLEHTKEQLSDGQAEWVQELPRTVEVADGSILMVHSHPKNVGEYVKPRDFPRMRRYLDDYVGLILGHTHIQHEATIDGRLILNPGSVGQPRDGDSKAAYAVIDTAEMEAKLHRVEYDIREVKQAVNEAGLPEKTGNRLARGR